MHFKSLHVAIRFAVSVPVCRIRVRIRTHRITPMRLHYNHFLPDVACRIRMPHPYLWNPSLTLPCWYHHQQNHLLTLPCWYHHQQNHLLTLPCWYHQNRVTIFCSSIHHNFHMNRCALNHMTIDGTLGRTPGMTTQLSNKCSVICNSRKLSYYMCLTSRNL